MLFLGPTPQFDVTYCFSTEHIHEEEYSEFLCLFTPSCSLTLYIKKISLLFYIIISSSFSLLFLVSTVRLFLLTRQTGDTGGVCWGLVEAAGDCGQNLLFGSSLCLPLAAILPSSTEGQRGPWRCWRVRAGGGAR